MVQDLYSSNGRADHTWAIRYAAVSKAPCVLCYSVAFLQPWGYPRTYAFPPITLITSVLRKLRATHTCDLTLIAPPFCPQEDGLQLCWTFPPTLQWNCPNVEICCTNRISIGFKTYLPFLRLMAWLLSSDSPVRQTSLRQWLAILPFVGEILD